MSDTALIEYMQDSDERIAYQATVTGDTIASSIWSITPAGATIAGPDLTATTATVEVFGLVVAGRAPYTLKGELILASGQIRNARCLIFCFQ